MIRLAFRRYLSMRQAIRRAMYRVLRPGGRLVLLDHVASGRRWVLAIERLLEPLALRMNGDYLTRRPLPLVQAAGFSVTWRQRSKAGIMGSRDHSVAAATPPRR